MAAMSAKNTLREVYYVFARIYFFLFVPLFSLEQVHIQALVFVLFNGKNFSKRRCFVPLVVHFPPNLRSGNVARADVPASALECGLQTGKAGKKATKRIHPKVKLHGGPRTRNLGCGIEKGLLRP